MQTATDSLGFDLAGADAPRSERDDRRILGLAVGHRTICADVRIMGGHRLDMVIDGDAGLGTAGAMAVLLGALQRGTGTWTHGRAWAEALSRRVQAGEVWA